MKIGVFDSGIGGKSVAKAIQKALPMHQVIFRRDSPDHFPYATKTPKEIFSYVVPVIEQLVADGCGAIVIACNTVSTTLIVRLRERFSVPLVAVEPMVKPAARLTQSNTIIVCATPTTLASQRYAELKAVYAQGVEVIEPNCAEWSLLIERNEMNEARIRQSLERGLASGADVVVLGCTHYHWIEQDIRQLAGAGVTVLQPEKSVVDELKRVIARLA